MARREMDEEADGEERWDVFLSHDWGVGNANHTRVVAVAQELRKAGLRVWLDEGEMARNVTVAQAMARGIERSKIVVVCVTHNYSDKVDMVWAMEGGSGKKKTDNCLREFTLAVQEKGMLFMVPAVMEPDMCDVSKWGSRLKMDLGEMLFVDLSASDDAGLRTAAKQLAERVRTKLADPMSGFANTVGRGAVFTVPFNNVFEATNNATNFAAGTRTWMLEHIVAWYKQPTGSRVFALLGAAAVGKSTIAAHLARRGGALAEEPVPLIDLPKTKPIAKRMGFFTKRMSGRSQAQNPGAGVVVRVGAIHLFKAGEHERSDLVLVFMSLATQLCAAVPGLAEQLLVVRKSLDSIATLRMLKATEMFKKLIAAPISKVSPPPGRVVIVLDALDECATDARRALTSLIQTEWTDFTPVWLGLVITSRPESSIPFDVNQFRPTELRTEDTSNMADLLAYLRQRLPGVVAAKDVEAAAKLLAKRSEGLFLYARFLEEQLAGHKGLTLAKIKKNSELFPAGLAGYYQLYFRRLLDSLDKNVASYKLLLSAMCAVRAPLPTDVVAALFPGKSKKKVKQLLAKAQNLVYVFADAATGKDALRFVHKSMSDWLLDEDNLDEDLALDEEEDLAIAHERLADWCLANKSHPFAVRHAVFHLGEAGKGAQLDKLVLDLEWLLSVSQAQAAGQMVLDADRIAQEAGEEAELAVRALEKGLHAISRDANEVPSQMMARLPATHPLVEEARAFRGVSWLCPVRPMGLTPASDPLRKILSGHTRPVLCVAVQDNVIVSGGEDKIVLACDRRTGQELLRLEGHTDYVTGVAIEGGIIVSCSKDKTVRVWDLESGEPLHKLEGHAKIINAVAVQDGLIVSGSRDQTVRVWDSESGKLVRKLEGHTRAVAAVAIHDDTIVSGGVDKTVLVWNKDSGKQLLKLEGHTKMVYAVALDDSVIVSGSNDKTARVWSRRTGEVLKVLAHDDAVTSVAIDSDMIVAGEDCNTVCTWSRASGELLCTLEGHTDAIKAVVVCGDAIVSGSYDSTVRVWDRRFDLKPSEPLGPRHAGGVTAIAMGRNVAVSGSADKILRVWDRSTGDCLSVLEGHTDAVTALALQDDDVIVSGSYDKTVRVWDCASGAELHKLVGHSGRVLSVAIDGDTIVSGGFDKSVRVWDRQSGNELLELEGHTDFVTAVAINADVIVSGSWDKTVRVWDRYSGEELHKLDHTGRADTVTILADGVVVSRAARSAATDDVVETLAWSLASGEPVEVTAAMFEGTTEENGLHVHKLGISAGFTCDAGVTVVADATRGDCVAVGDYSGGVHILEVRE